MSLEPHIEDEGGARHAGEVKGERKSRRKSAEASKNYDRLPGAKNDLTQDRTGDHMRQTNDLLSMCDNQLHHQALSAYETHIKKSSYKPNKNMMLWLVPQPRLHLGLTSEGVE